MNNSEMEQARVNKTANTLYTIISTILLLAYVVQFVKGEKTLGLFLIIVAADIIPVVACWVLYSMNNATDYCKDIMGICYGILYEI